MVQRNQLLSGPGCVVQVRDTGTSLALGPSPGGRDQEAQGSWISRQRPPRTTPRAGCLVDSISRALLPSSAPAATVEVGVEAGTILQTLSH